MNKLYYFLIGLLFLTTSCVKFDNSNIENIEVEGGENITFEAPEVSSGKTIYWDFGDGNYSNDHSPSHIYTSPGKYKVTYSLYRRNGKFIKKVHRYNVEVTQNYKPRVLGADISGEEYYDYLYQNKDGKLSFIVPENIENDDSINYEISIDGQTLYYSDYATHNFTDTGFHDLKFTVIDKYGGEGHFDTSVFVGDDQTRLNITIPEVYSAQLGNVSEKYYFVYDSEYSFQFDYNDIEDYPGPSIGPLVNGNEHMYFYGPGPNDYIYSSLSTLSFKTLPNISNGMTDQITIPAYDGYDINELYILVVIVGDNGMCIGFEDIAILPGSNTPHYEINLSYNNY